MKFNASFESRFTQKIQKTAGCWYWIANKINTGYGRVWSGYERVLAHRASYEFYIGRIHTGTEVMHTCDNPGCVNPGHLRLGTHRQNMHDKIEKGRDQRYKFSESQIQQMVRQRKNRVPLSKIGELFKVDKKVIKRVLSEQGEYENFNDKPASDLERQTDRIIELRDEGRTLSEIGTIFAVDKGSVKKLLTKHSAYAPLKPGRPRQ